MNKLKKMITAKIDNTFRRSQLPLSKRIRNLEVDLIKLFYRSTIRTAIQFFLLGALIGSLVTYIIAGTTK